METPDKEKEQAAKEPPPSRIHRLVDEILEAGFKPDGFAWILSKIFSNISSGSTRMPEEAFEAAETDPLAKLLQTIYTEARAGRTEAAKLIVAAAAERAYQGSGDYADALHAYLKRAGGKPQEATRIKDLEVESLTLVTPEGERRAKLFTTHDGTRAVFAVGATDGPSIGLEADIRFNNFTVRALDAGFAPVQFGLFADPDNSDEVRPMLLIGDPDKEGMPYLRLSLEETLTPQLALFDQVGGERAALRLDDEGVPALAFYAPDSEGAGVVLKLTPDSPEPPFVKGLRLILRDEATPADLHNAIVDCLHEAINRASSANDEHFVTEYHRALMRLAAKKEE